VQLSLVRHQVIEIKIQVRTIEAIPAVETGDLALPLDHLRPAAVTGEMSPYTRLVHMGMGGLVWIAGHVII
jgi:hypothetical protein